MQKVKAQTKNWRKVRLGEIGEIVTGKTPPTAEKDYFNGEFPFITPTDINDFNVRYNYVTDRFLSKKWLAKAKNLLIPRNSTCFVCIGSTIGKICLVKEDSFTNQQINTVIVDSRKADFNYIYYLLKYNQRNIVKEYGGGGAAKSIINKSTFENIEFFIPNDSAEQKRIADILSVFDDKIEVNNKINHNLEQMAQAIFKEWFAAPPEVLEKKGKLPKGWKIKKLGEIATIEYGKGPSTKDIKKLGYPVYGANGVIGYSEKYIFENSQIIIGCRGVVGSLFMTLPKSSVTHNSLIINPVSFSERNYLFMLLKNSNLQSVVGGSAQPQITIKDLSQMPILFADQGARQKFEEIVDKIEQKRLNIIYENQRLSSLRDSLLSKLMSGEIRV